MKYLVTATLKPNRQKDLLESVTQQTLGRGSIAGHEYLRNMRQARLLKDGRVLWVEVCFCPTPLQEEQPYWEEYFNLERVEDAHNRKRCRDLNGKEPWACCNCNCTSALGKHLDRQGQPFLETLTNQAWTKKT